MLITKCNKCPLYKSEVELDKQNCKLCFWIDVRSWSFGINIIAVIAYLVSTVFDSYLISRICFAAWAAIIPIFLLSIVRGQFIYERIQRLRGMK